MKNIYSLVNEPVGDTYKKLILFALKYCDNFLFVKHHRKFESESVKNLIKALEPYLIIQKESNEWPGTISVEKATVYQYRLTSESADILINYANGLYSWNQVDLPEDLCLIRPDGNPWLVSITYEKDGYLELTEGEKQDLVKEIPELILIEGKE